MATARELLDQADALMRRNRANAIDDIPVLTEAVPAVQLPRAIRTRAAPPDEGPDSVPVLTENIDVIEIEDETATVQRETVEGEPSVWLELEDGEPSVIGDAPDSIAFVPPVRLRPPPDEALLASAEHEEIELTLPREDATGDVAAAEADGWARARADVEGAARKAAAMEQASREAAEREAAEREITERQVVARELAEREAAARETAEREAAAQAQVQRETAAREQAEREQAAREQAEREQAEREQAEREQAEREAAEQEAAARELAELEAATRPTAGPFAVVAEDSAGIAAIAGDARAPAPAALSIAEDDERWAAAAEEIRMQVLQRIDLFTDTGLRDQLAQRLQPIADRASADFVAAINLHVGDLLRSYVAEAIEREIEQWRRDH